MCAQFVLLCVPPFTLEGHIVRCNSSISCLHLVRRDKVYIETNFACVTCNSQTGGYKVRWSQGYIILRRGMCCDFHVKDRVNITGACEVP